MKQFRKEDNLYVCEECKKLCKNLKSLSKHIQKNHNGIKNYFDKWIKDTNEELCRICNKQTIFKGLSYGYNCGCCNKHSMEIANETRKKTLLKFYDVENNFQRTDCKNKMKITWIENYGVDNPNKSKMIRNKIEKTNIQKYGTTCSLANKDIKLKAEKTCEKNFGVKNPFSSKIIQNNLKQYYLEKYGVENPLQDKDIFNKAFKTRILLHQYKDTNITYQASYEFDFLENFYSLFNDIQNGPSIKYKHYQKNKVYHSDFYIPSKNLIIEIKGTYTLMTNEEEILEKEKATKLLGYDYILILNKNYNEFIQKYVKK
jgi:uncharacterized C2H2 Zn-finger protein